jgi:hypothetical protein
VKLLCCSKCHDVIKPRYEWVWCNCKNIGGCYYKDGKNFFVSRKDKSSSRVIGVDNKVRYGLQKRSYSVIQEPKSKEGKKVFEIPYNSELDYNEIMKEADEIVGRKKNE